MEHPSKMFLRNSVSWYAPLRLRAQKCWKFTLDPDLCKVIEVHSKIFKKLLFPFPFIIEDGVCRHLDSVKDFGFKEQLAKSVLLTAFFSRAIWFFYSTIRYLQWSIDLGVENIVSGIVYGFIKLFLTYFIDLNAYPDKTVDLYNKFWQHDKRSCNEIRLRWGRRRVWTVATSLHGGSVFTTESGRKTRIFLFLAMMIAHITFIVVLLAGVSIMYMFPTSPILTLGPWVKDSPVPVKALYFLVDVPATIYFIFTGYSMFYGGIILHVLPIAGTFLMMHDLRNYARQELDFRGLETLQYRYNALRILFQLVNNMLNPILLPGFQAFAAALVVPMNYGVARVYFQGSFVFVNVTPAVAVLLLAVIVIAVTFEFMDHAGSVSCMSTQVKKSLKYSYGTVARQRALAVRSVFRLLIIRKREAAMRLIAVESAIGGRLSSKFALKFVENVLDYTVTILLIC